MVKIVVHAATYVVRAKHVPAANASRTAVRVQIPIYVLSMERMSAKTQKAMMQLTVAHAIMHVPITRQQTPHQALARLVFVSTHATAVTQIAVASQHQAFDASKQQICKRMVKIVVLVAKSAVQAKHVSAANVFRTAVRALVPIYVLLAVRTSAKTQKAMMPLTAVRAIMHVPITLLQMPHQTLARQVFVNTHATAVIQTVVTAQRQQASTVLKQQTFSQIARTAVLVVMYAAQAKHVFMANAYLTAAQVAHRIYV